MRYAEYDYHELHNAGKCVKMDRYWDAHWHGRRGLKEDLSEEPLWSTIQDHVGTPGRLLEAGCGTGQWVQYLGQLGHDAVGVDYALSGLAVGRKHNRNLNLMQADFRNLPFDDSTFDYIVSLGAIEHDINGPEAALGEFRRILKPSGKLLCSVPCMNIYRILGLPWMLLRRSLKCREPLRRLWGKTLPFAFYEYLWSPGHYRKILGQAGFQVLDMRGYGTVIKSRITKLCDMVISRYHPLSSAHMMMAICRKA